MNKTQVTILFTFLAIPFISFADEVDNFIANVSREILNPIVELLFVLALLFFTWGVFKFVANPDAPAERETGKQNMIWGVVGMFVMVGAYGLIWFLRNSLGI